MTKDKRKDGLDRSTGNLVDHLWIELDKLTEVVKKMSDAVQVSFIDQDGLLLRMDALEKAVIKMERQLSYLPGGSKNDEILDAMRKLKK